MTDTYDQAKYEKAKSWLAAGKVPADKVPIVQQRVAQYEDDRARGYLPAPAAKTETPLMAETQTADETTANALGGMNSWLSESKSDTADVIRSTMEASQLQARKEAFEQGKKLARDEKLPTASKLKVFSTPAEYEPPKAPGLMGMLPKPADRYFEPTVNEFKQVVAADKRLASRLQAGNPDIDIASLSDDELANSDAFRVYADARWQNAYADAMKSRTPIIRVAYSQKDWMGGGKGPDGKGQASGADLMDGTMALASGALQGGTMGGYHLGLSALGGDEARAAEMGSMDRHPVLGTLGTLAGAMNHRSLPSKLAGGMSKLGRPSSLVGRVGKAGAAGAATAIIDENIRAAASLAADALDAEETAAEGVARIWEGLPGANSNTAMLGAGIGAGADLLGAGAGALAKGAPKALDLREPLQHLEASGGQIGLLGGPKLSPRAQAWANRAGKQRTTAQDMISESAVQPMARQVMLEQEAAKRGAELQTSVAQAKLEGIDVPTKDAALAIQAEAQSIRPVTALARKQQKDLLDLSQQVAQAGNLTADQLDDMIQQVDDAAKLGQHNAEPVKHMAAASKHLRDLRDRFAVADDVTAVDGPNDATTVDPPNKIAGIRDSDGNVSAKEGYSALKAQQYKDRTLQEFKTARIMGRPGRPKQLTAEPVIADPVPGKTPEEVVSGAKPKVRLSLDEHKALKQNIRKIARPDDLEDAKEVLSLAGRVGPGMERKLRIIQQLDDADRLATALGSTINGVSARGGGIGAFVNKQQLFRAVPTLQSLSGGLPRVGSPAASDWSVARLRKFIANLPAASAQGAKGALKGAVSRGEPRRSFMPTLPGIGLRAGLPSRAVAASQEEPEVTDDFSPEETEFWLQVINKLTEEK